eukprot:SAG31_NODE_22594_length_522_cov_0.966903_2_plen_71_part_01
MLSITQKLDFASTQDFGDSLDFDSQEAEGAGVGSFAGSDSGGSVAASVIGSAWSLTSSWVYVDVADTEQGP